MDFEYSPQEAKVAETCRGVAEEDLAPLDAQIDRECRIPEEVYRKLAGLGFTARIIPEKFGGLGGTVTELVIQEENLAYGCATVASSIMATNLCLVPIVLYGSDEQKRRYLPGLMDGTSIGGIGITEPGAGSDAAAMSASAVRDGDEWVLNGSKRLIDNVSNGDVFLVWAKTDPNAAPAHKGISAFIVERDSPGFKVNRIHNVIGLRGLGVGAFDLIDCRIPAENLVGETGQGWTYLMRMLEIGRAGAAAVCVGIAQAALDEAKRYARSRQVFGTTLERIQAIQFKVAEAATRIDMARMLVHRAAKLIDAGKRSDRESSMAKFWAAETAFFASYEAVQIFGGIGCTDEAPAERHMRDARIFTIGEGTGEIQRTVIARREFEMLGERG